VEQRSRGELFFGLFVLCLFILLLYQVIAGNILSDSIHIFIFYFIVCIYFYLSIWGNLAKTSYDSISNWSFMKKKINLEDHTKNWKKSAIIFFIFSTLILLISYFNN